MAIGSICRDLIASAIAKRLVEMMHGKIGLESGADGRGSLAWFTLLLPEVKD
jgi:signal transduction histidine kinase